MCIIVKLRKCNYLDKDYTYPVRHWVCPGAPEVPVDDDNCHQNTHRVHDEGEQ